MSRLILAQNDHGLVALVHTLSYFAIVGARDHEKAESRSGIVEQIAHYT
jgi:hypothetical protein